jgi:hypothetical protein
MELGSCSHDALRHCSSHELRRREARFRDDVERKLVPAVAAPVAALSNCGSSLSKFLSLGAARLLPHKVNRRSG